MIIGCASESAVAPVDDSAGETASATDSASGDTIAADTAEPIDTTTADTAATPDGAFVRIFDGLDGAEIYVCEDGARIGGTYSRIGSGGSIASGYIETTKLGMRRVHAQASTAPSCLAATSSDPSYSLAKGEHKTLFVRAIAGFNAILSVADDVTAPAAGKARVRVFSGATAFATTHGLLDVCVAAAPWAKGLPGAASGGYLEVTPGAAAVEVRKATTPPCTGVVVATVSVTTQPNATHTLFLVDGRGTGAKDHATFCTDANAGVAVKTASCTDSAL